MQILNNLLGIKTVTSDNPPADLFLPQSFLKAVETEILLHPKDETGGYIYGFRITNKGRKHVVILGSYTPPFKTEVKRTMGHLDLGGKESAEYHRWFKAHWPQLRQEFIKRFPGWEKGVQELKPEVIGTWHRHPGNFIGFSGEDDHTIDHKKLGTNRENYLFPIFVVRKKSAQDPYPPPLVVPCVQIRVSKTTFIEGVFYFRERQNKLITYELEPLIDRVEGNFPAISQIPWHLSNAELFDAECSALEASGFTVTPVLFTPKGKEAKEFWLELNHPNHPQPIFIKTSDNFLAKPQITIALTDPRVHENPEILSPQFTKTIAKTVMAVLPKPKQESETLTNDAETTTPIMGQS